jgi:hypothetical protein
MLKSPEAINQAAHAWQKLGVKPFHMCLSSHMNLSSSFRRTAFSWIRSISEIWETSSEDSCTDGNGWRGVSSQEKEID